MDPRKIKDASALNHLTPPPAILHREADIDWLEKFVFKNTIFPENVFVYGSAGTGKTLIIKYLMDKYKDSGVKFYYINLGHKGLYKSFQDAVKEITGKEMKGGHITDYMRAILEHFSKEGCYHVLALDEIDKVLKEKEDMTLYPLLRPDESFNLSVKLSLICAGNDVGMPNRLSQSVVSSFGHLWWKFYNYNEEQLFAIVKQRADSAFYPGTISDSNLQQIAVYATPCGDARYAIKLLRTSAEISNNSSITHSDIDKAREMMEQQEIEMEFEKLSEHSLILIHIVNLLHPDAIMPLIYEVYKKTCEVLKLPQLSYRQAFRLLEDAYKSGVLNCVVEYERHGNPIRYFPSVDKDRFLTILQKTISFKIPAVLTYEREIAGYAAAIPKQVNLSELKQQVL